MVKNQFVDSESEESSSSLSLELVVERKEEERHVDAAQEAAVYDFDLETIKDKPWLKPGANITDYFNYGFTEKTWKKYCDMQKQTRDWAKNNRAPEDDGLRRNRADADYGRRRDHRRF